MELGKGRGARLSGSIAAWIVSSRLWPRFLAVSITDRMVL